MEVFKVRRHGLYDPEKVDLYCWGLQKWWRIFLNLFGKNLWKRQAMSEIFRERLVTFYLL